MSSIGIDDVKLISASAGTGKTTRLVDEIIHALEQYPASRIAAVTFTNAAVRDLKNKITDRLKDTPKKDAVKEITISTIHSFFAQILREQSLKLNISPTFNIITDTAATKIILYDICKDVLSKKISEDEYKNIFLEYSFPELMGIMERLENKYSFIRRNMKRTYNDFLALEREGEAKKLYQLTGKDFIHKVLDVLIEAECTGKPCTITEARAAMLQNMKDLKVALQEFAKGAETKKFKRNSLKNICQILKNIIPSMTVRGSKGMEDLYDAYKVLKEVSETVEELRLGDDYVSEQAAQILEKLVKLFSQVHDSFAKEKRRMESLDYNDIELMTYDLIHDHPQISEYYKAKYSYILVDEFQDTNDLQSKVLFDISKKLFLVGDAKQSIYRFRNADVRVFVETQKKIPNAVVEELKSNYRSRRNIVDTVNIGFEILFDKWTQEKQLFDPEYMKMDMGKAYDGDGVVRFFNVGDPEKKSASVELEALCAANLINDRVNYGREYGDFAILFRTKSNIPVFEKFLIKNNIPYVVWGDTDKSQIIERLMALFSFVINPYNDFNLLQTIKLPPFYISDECIYRLRKDNEHMWTSISDYDISKNKYDFLKQDITSIGSLKSFFSRCENLAYKGGNFTEYVARVLAYSDFIPSMEAIYTGREIGLEEMILKIAQNVEETGGTRSDFLEFLSMSMSDKNDLEVEGAVRLMTVHASKGLDFPIVIMPCLHNIPPRDDLFVASSDGDISLKLRNQLGYDRKPTPYHSFIKEDEDKAELAESKRLFYVASTRAKQELYFIGNFTGSLNKAIKGEELKAAESKRWVDWVSYIFNNDIQDAPVRVGEHKIQTRILREIIRVDEETNVIDKKDENFERSMRRYSVSMIRDFAVSPQHMLDNIIETDLAGPVEGSEQIGGIVHAVLENYGDQEALKNIFKDLPEKTFKNIVGIVKKFMASDIGKKVFDAKDYKSEHGFITKILSNIVTGRVDRINIYDDSIWVIDYKTGIDEKMLEGYKAQMACYMYYAKRMHPDIRVYGSIIDVSKCTEISYESDQLNDWLEATVKNLDLFLSK